MVEFMAVLICFALLFLHGAFSLPLCLNQEAPSSKNVTLSFCSDYSGPSSCCNKADDAQIQAQFQSLNISDPTCSQYMKQVLCSKCDTYAWDLYQQRSVPVLCNSTTDTKAYCYKVWDACKKENVATFSPSLIGTSPPGSSLSGKATSQNQTLSQEWISGKGFCGVIGSGDSLCFDGNKYKFSASGSVDTPPGVCFDKVGEDGLIGLVPHPDGSNRAFLATQAGQIYLVTLPDEGSGKQIVIDKKSPFLDISNLAVVERELGLMSVAFHPDFVKNGRFFVSFNCDKQRWPGCGGGRCACNPDVGCDPSLIRTTDGTLPCQYSSVISEFSAGNSTVRPAQAVTANPNEVTRILTMGLPYGTHHGGLLLFGPKDKYLYFMMGDGGGAGDPFNFAQNKKSLLGKILRLDIDNKPTDQEVTALGLWGKYSIPESNPFVQENNSRPEIWALGLRNPWRCSFDSVKPEYLYCSDVGQSVYEEVNLVTKGGNYGWRVYDGVANYTPPWSPGGNTSASSIDPIFPVATYLHDGVNKAQGSASIIGGYVSRSVQDPCLYGKYLYADLYGGNMWGITETPEGSGNYSTAALNFICSKNSPAPCKFVSGSSLPEIGFVFAFGEDNSRNVYMLTTVGTFKVTNPSKCNYTCSKKLPAGVTSPPLSPIPSPPPPPSSSQILRVSATVKIVLLGCFLLSLVF